MTDYEQNRDSFRKSKTWENFRKVKFADSSKDYITHKKLKANYPLHHLDLNPDNYQDLSNISHFENLNRESHSWVHEIYKYYRKDPKVLDRLKEVLDRMVEINQ